MKRSTNTRKNGKLTIKKLVKCSISSYASFNPSLVEFIKLIRTKDSHLIGDVNLFFQDSGDVEINIMIAGKITESEKFLMHNF